MPTRFLLSAIALATLATAAPAFAQDAEGARFAQAQDRFDRELALYRQAFDRFRSAGGGDRGYAAPAPNGPYRQAPDARVAPDDDGYDDEGDEDGYDPARDYRQGTDYR